jgi:hypothetical protein
MSFHVSFAQSRSINAGVCARTLRRRLPSTSLLVFNRDVTDRQEFHVWKEVHFSSSASIDKSISYFVVLSILLVQPQADGLAPSAPASAGVVDCVMFGRAANHAL